MPDFERVVDQLRCDLAKTPEDLAFAKGVIAGKTRARKEVLVIAAFLALIGVVVALARLQHLS